MDSQEIKHPPVKKTTVGGGIAGIGLGTFLLTVAPEITSSESVIKFIQLSSPTISVASAYFLKVFFTFCKNQYRLNRLQAANRFIDKNVNDSNLASEYKEKLIHQKGVNVCEAVALMGGNIFNNNETSLITQDPTRQKR